MNKSDTDRDRQSLKREERQRARETGEKTKPGRIGETKTERDTERDRERIKE